MALAVAFAIVVNDKVINASCKGYRFTHFHLISVFGNFEETIVNQGTYFSYFELVKNQMLLSDGWVKANSPSCFLFSGKGGQLGADVGLGFIMNHSGDK